MKRSSLCVLLFSLLISSSYSLVGQETELTFSLDENVHKPLLVEIDAVQDGEIYATYFAFTHKDITQALIDAHNRGVKVKVALDYFGHNQKAATVLRNAGVPVRIFNYHGKGRSHLHSKSTVIRHADGKNVVFLGSANASIQSHKNSEVVVITRNNDEYYAQNRDFFDVVWNLSIDVGQLYDETDVPEIYPTDLIQEVAQSHLTVTPQKSQMIHSGEYDLSESAFARRIESTNVKTETLDILLYSFNDPVFKKALQSFFAQGGKGRLIVDPHAVTSQRKFLDKLVADGALVYVYNPQKRSASGTSLQHIKALVRHGDKPLVVISENNPTIDAQTDLGKAVLYPNDINLAAKMAQKINDLVNNYCDLYVPVSATQQSFKRKLFENKTTLQQIAKRPKDKESQMQMLMELKRLQQQLESSITDQFGEDITDMYYN